MSLARGDCAQTRGGTNRLGFFDPIMVATAIAISAVVSVGIAMPVQALGQEKKETETGSSESESEASGRQVRIADQGATLERPEGWVRSKAGEGAVCTLRAAGDDQAQIEVRISTPIPDNKRTSFFNSFHSSLKEAGFIKRREAAGFGTDTASGRLTEYDGTSDGDKFRLVVWQMHRDEAAWLVVGFFPAARAGRYHDDFESLIESLSFED